MTAPSSTICAARTSRRLSSPAASGCARTTARPAVDGRPSVRDGQRSEAHRNLRLLQSASLHDEVIGPRRAYEAIRMRLSQSQCAMGQPAAMQSVAPRMTLFRFPYGACNDVALREVHDQGLRAIQWDISTGDPTPQQSAAAIVRAISHARPGSIIVNHANGRGWHTAQALPLAINKLRNLGFQVCYCLRADRSRRAGDRDGLLR